MKIQLLSFVLGLPILCVGQAAPTGNQVANNASCSNTQIDAKGNVTFKCSGLSPEQAKIIHDIPFLLNKIFRDQQKDTTAILDRLNGCVVSVQELKEGYWPNLTKQQINDLASMLPPSPNTRIDIVVPNGDDHNKVSFGKSLRSIFEKAQWNVSISYPEEFPSGDPPTGLVISAKKDSQDLQSLAKMLFSAFGRENVTGKLVNGLFDPTTTIAIEIWPRKSILPPTSN